MGIVMARAVSTPSFELPLPASRRVAARAAKRPAFPESLLAENALWFCRLRWIAIAILTAFGVIGLFTDRVASIGLLFRSDWPLVMAGILVVANLLFIGHVRLLVRSGAERGAGLNIWCQIALDLVAHTVVVHFLGCLETYALFVYLFHIVLSCIFFSRLQSLLVTILACALFSLCFGLEAAGVVSPASVYADAGNGGYLDRLTWASGFNVASAMAIWLVVWYMASYLSALVRERGVELAETNRRLIEAQEERARHVLRTTHELKAPFAAIHANVQLLVKGHCGPFTEEAREVLLRIAGRCRCLAHEIQQMLQLANLRSASEDAKPEEDLCLDTVLRESVAHVQPMAEEREVVIEEDLRPVRIRFAREHLRILLDNLLSNAVAYSREGGHVRLECDQLPGGDPLISVEDHGIGIKEHKLPLIFNEYFRTDEGVRHNKESTGLGLTIVRHVAQTHGIGVRVESQFDEGTKFILRFPPRCGSTEAANERKEVANAVPVSG